jgi:1-acyl-sn-glycerol-3-phosphate acyltransferase
MLITQRMYKGPLRLLFSTAGMIEVDETGREALTRSLAVLRRGGLVGVFPEGTRGAGGAEVTQGGAAWLAIHANVPVVPVALFGTRHTGESVNIWPKPGRRLLAAFGDPFMPTRPDGLKGAALVNHARDEIETVLKDHVQSVAATTDIDLPVDDPIRDRGREVGT